MRMSEGVEWALHCCLTLAWLDGETVPTATLAAAFEVPPHYLNKILQALVRTNILTSTAGVKGGFRLARPATKISVLDVVDAVEGPEEAFRCTEIRQRGPGKTANAKDFFRPCGIAAVMARANVVWRKELARTTIADLAREAGNGAERTRCWHAARAR